MKVGATDDFERQYMAEFRKIAAPHGVFVEYEMDRAGRDLGLHLTQPAHGTKGKIMTPALVWFQMKGIMAGTLSLEEVEKLHYVTVSLDTAHLRFWFMNIQPTYLVVYVEAARKFLTIDIKEYVSREFGDDILTHKAKTVSVRIFKNNVLDDHFFRVALNRNLVPAIRERFANDDAAAARFLRDSGLIKQLSIVEAKGKSARIRIIDWQTKMRTEVWFSVENDAGEWERIRNHWEFALKDIPKSYPFLDFKPEREAKKVTWVEYDEDWDGNEVARHREDFEIVADDEEEDRYYDDDDFDGHCLLDLGGGLYSYGEMAGGEYVEHTIKIRLNETGARWAETLKVFEAAEILTVDTTPHWLSVAPWNPGYV